MSDRWIWVSLPRAAFAVVTRDGLVVAAYFRILRAEFAEIPAPTG